MDDWTQKILSSPTFTDEFVQKILSEPVITSEIAIAAGDFVGALLDLLPNFDKPLEHINPGQEYFRYVNYFIALSQKLDLDDYSFHPKHALDIGVYSFFVGEVEFAKSTIIDQKELIGVDPYFEFQACCWLSEIHEILGDLEAAKEFKNEALFVLEYYQVAKDNPEHQYSSDYYSMCHYHFMLRCSKGQELNGNYLFALDIVRMVLDKVDENHQYSKLPSAHMQEGSIMASRNELKSAENAYLRAVEWAEKFENLVDKADCYEALALIQAKRKGYEEAVSNLQNARKYLQQLGDLDQVKRIESYIEGLSN
jgi:tetratricopeptide (TPR) repeat protein